MYKVSYYLAGTRLAFKWFPDLHEATKFSISLPAGDVLEIKLYKDQVKKEDRT